jgi:diguanylate cyclase (GGDEF)-like protein
MDLLQRADVLTDLFEKFEMILESTKFLAAAVCLYDTPIILKKAYNFSLPNRVNLGVAVDLETGEKQINKNISFNPNEQMLPENIFQNKKGQYVMQPIFYGENQYGYIICRIESKMYVHNSIFLKLLSNAIAQAYEFTEKVEESKRLSKENKILQNRYKNLNEQSKLDELTNVLNRRGFMEIGQKSIDFALEMNLVGLVVFGDMNGLKVINDTYGHEMGDIAIQHQAEVLKKTFRSNDVIGRLSGDEFAVIITSSRLDSLDSIREKVNKMAVSVCYQSDLPFSISISLGAVEFNKENFDLKELLKRADEQQYIEKRKYHKERR